MDKKMYPDRGGQMFYESFADPGADSELWLRPPAGDCWILFGVRFRFRTLLPVGNRYIYYRIDGGANEGGRYYCQIVHIANTTKRYNFVWGYVGTEYEFDSNVVVFWPGDFLMTYAYHVRINWLNAQLGDEIDNAYAYGLRWADI